MMVLRIPQPRMGIPLDALHRGIRAQIWQGLIQFITIWIIHMSKFQLEYVFSWGG
jgi:hypothetical protein